MTSSLVGSEMCIRDSAATGQWWYSPYARDHPDHAPPPGTPPVPPQAPGCLLYTSDAADDM
eukprot:266021-Prorocentrum_lima.AAC.1